MKPIAWATIYSCAGREDRVEIGDANPAQERMAETWGWQHRRVPLVELPADQVLVPRELLDRLNAAVSSKDSVAASIAISELRALLQR
ncbi:hypothetical protein D9M71_659170 [compost metagenome]